VEWPLSSAEIVAQLDLEQLLRSVTDRARKLTRAQTTSLCLLNSDGEHLDLAASSPEAAAHTERRQPVQRGLAAQVVGAGETVVTEAGCAGCDILHIYAPGQCVAAPLRVGEQTLGALCAIRAVALMNGRSLALCELSRHRCGEFTLGRIGPAASPTDGHPSRT
jgi:transcriptional regulator with GAF, ATPase, and Fis domain